MLVLLILTGSGLLYAVHAPLAYRARLLATVPLRAMPLDLTIDAADNRVFVSDDDGHLVILDARTGRVVGSAALINGAMPLYAASARRLFVLGADGVEMRSASGAPLRTLPIGRAILGMAIDDRRDHLFIAGYQPVGLKCGTGSLVMVDARAGRILHTTPIDLPPTSGPSCIPFYAGPPPITLDAQAGHLFVAGWTAHQKRPRGMWVSGNMVSGPYFTVDKLLMIDAAIDALLRTIPLHGSTQDFVLDARTHRLFLNNDVGLIVLDTVHGAILHVYPEPVTTWMAVDQQHDRLYLLSGTTRRTTLQVRSGQSGALLRTVPLAGPAYGTSVLLDPLSHRLFFLRPSPDANNSTVTVFDTDDGSLLDTVLVGGQSIAMALDQRIGRLFVLNQGNILAVPSQPPESG